MPTSAPGPASPDVLADGTPVRLGRYRLVRPISTGGMARVFEGRRESLAGVAPRVAVKVILPDYADHDGFQRLFINEARIGSLLTHQNLVQIQDFDREGDRFYLVMEFVEGLTLRRVISLCRRHGLPVPLSVIAEIGRQTCDGLEHAHRARSEDGHALHLVHRDLKPSNLMLNPHGVVKLLDFGISKALLTGEKDGAVRGTWGYMAPEQARGEEVSAPADLFGLAAVLYELAALQPLFAERGPDEIRALLESDEAARRAAALTGPMAPLSGVLVRALQRDPAARFTSASAMGRALAGLVDDPVRARDRLVRFQQDMTVRAEEALADARAKVGGPAHRSAAPASAPSAGSAPASTMDRGVGPGLPVAIGSRQGPGLREPPSSVTPTQGASPWPGRLLAVGLPLLAVAIVLFTAWKLLSERMPAGPASDPAPSAPAAPALDRLADTPEPAAPVRPAPSEPERAATPAPAPERAPTPAPTKVPAPTATPVAATPAPSPTPAPVAAEPAPVEAAATHRVSIGSTPRAAVMVDKQPRGYTPLVGVELSPGRHAVTLETEDGRRSTFAIQVAAGQDNQWVYDFETKSFQEQ
ncbi:MAG: protein kinase [Alphaproteobacteria bacterium]|nr:protein kinase [Alphaproteobacteria bacterium]